MLKFRFYFTKTGNLFHFISNLSEWHFSCRERYNKIWLEETGPLNDKEKQALKRMGNLFLKYNFESNFLGIPFITNPDTVVWEKVKNWVDEEEFNELKETFSVFEPRFEKIWQSEEAKLAKWKNTLTKELTKQKYQDLEKDLETFFNQKPQFRNIDIYLLISAIGSGGGASIGPGRVTLECTALPTTHVLRILGVLYHETAHLVFEYGYYKNLLEQFLEPIKDKFSKRHAFFKSGRDLRVMINEATMSSLLPEGYLASKYFGRDVFHDAEKVLGTNFENIAKGKECDFRAYRLFVAAKLFPLVKNYIENKNPIDENYLQSVWKVFEEFSKKII